jgi:pyrroline-5-carboxylate reductase
LSQASFQDLSGVNPAFSHLLFERTEYSGLTAGLTKDFESVGLTSFSSTFRVLAIAWANSNHVQLSLFVTW